MTPTGALLLLHWRLQKWFFHPRLLQAATRGKAGLQARGIAAHDMKRLFHRAFQSRFDPRARPDRIARCDTRQDRVAGLRDLDRLRLARSTLTTTAQSDSTVHCP